MPIWENCTNRKVRSYDRAEMLRDIAFLNALYNWLSGRK
ncbi:hypothetical protein GXM_09236 [Nostoc sphaeroides CCNUC1]|uniref:Uncharacterized protein n=1 Tax=Nostoc sphaeroides CCNUC1 TaxID=2653204 RepID=A0A5P8WGU7_9NOSO|nr:hypothetical protein GXM_09236 [Nostoc sphaeroides CCNUC1]